MGIEIKPSKEIRTLVNKDLPNKIDKGHLAGEGV
jgi:hypothetical protein